MPTLRMNNVWTSIDGSPTRVLEYVHSLEVPIENGPGLCNIDGRSFLSGIAALVAEKLNCQLIDEREPVATPTNLAKFLRPYQGEAVGAGLAATRGILSAPTGAGKTLYTAGLCKAVRIPWLYFVHRPNLVAQTAKKLRELLNEPVAEIRGSGERLDDSRIICATFQAFKGHRFAPMILEQIRGIIVDEAHRAPTASALACILSADRAYYRLGLSATPLLRTDRRDILTIGLLGPVAHEIGAQELVDEGYLTELVFHWLPGGMAWGSGTKDWQKFYDEAIVDSHDRNVTIVQAVVHAPKPAIVFVKKRAHARQLTDALRCEIGTDVVELADGDCSTTDREAIIARAQEGKTSVVVATAIFYEGVDIPEVASVVIASAGQSAIEAIQRIGRGTRLHEGKHVCHIYDVADRGHRWLETHTEARYNAYQLAGWTVPHPFPKPKQENIDRPHAPTAWLTWTRIAWACIALGFLCSLLRS